MVMTTSTRGYRPCPDLPEALVAAVQEWAGHNGVTLAELWFHWVALAAQLARSGQGHLLPPGGRAHRHGGGVTQGVRWRQGKRDFERCQEQIEAAGSSVPAVLREAGAAYVAARGDLLVMSWPDFQCDSNGSRAVNAA